MDLCGPPNTIIQKEFRKSKQSSNADTLAFTQFLASMVNGRIRLTLLMLEGKLRKQKVQKVQDRSEDFKRGKK
jgi:hypothetical protein